MFIQVLIKVIEIECKRMVFKVNKNIWSSKVKSHQV